MSLNVDQIRKQFPILERKINSRNLIYLDNAATTLKPQQVVDRISEHYLMGASNVHRGIHTLSNEATNEFEKSRELVKNFINASLIEEIVFTSGTTGSINLVAHSFGDSHINESDTVLITEMDHHSNIVPWHMLANRIGCKVKGVHIDGHGELDLNELESLLSKRPKLLVLTHISNTLGTLNPIKEITDMAHTFGTLVCVDAAQSVAHLKVDVQDLDCDFLAFSGHKMFGPTGTGVLYGKRELFQEMPPFLGGGGMIDKVTLSGVTYLDPPQRFEAGTPHIAGIIGLGEAIEFIESIGPENIFEYETKLLNYANSQLQDIPGLKIIGTSENKGPIITFILDEIHPHDIASLLDEQGIAVRTGHHCTQPILRKWGVESTTRASFSIYNTEDEIDSFREALFKVLEIFK